MITIKIAREMVQHFAELKQFIQTELINQFLSILKTRY